MVLDYKKIGLKCGLEIHQQLATKHKLFCNCSARLEDKEPVFSITRKLRPVAGETGEIDQAAAYETLKDKTFRYFVYLNESCEVEMDEEPPHPLNPEALEIALQVALMLNCEIPEEIQVMRKAVLDGSNTTGFQRTAIVGINGWLETNFGKVGITNVSVEEDACQIMDKKTKGGTDFGLNRLGVPLVEIGTTANIPNPEEAREVAEKIGMILRSTGRVRRGIGTIRQDVNVSIKGGERTEIKGFQELRMIPRIIDHEIKRQQDIIKKKKKVSRDVRKALADGGSKFLRPLPGAARMYPETDVTPIEIAEKRLDEMRKRLPKLISDKASDIQKLGLAPDLAKNIAKNPRLMELFTELVKLKKIKPTFLASTLVSYPRILAKEHKGSDITLITNDHMKKVFHALNKGTITKDSVMELLAQVAQGRELNIQSSAGGLSEADVRKIVRSVIAANPQALSHNRPEQALMGLVMKEIRGRADGGLVMKVLSQEIKK
jgi:Glu-tRNA(Gln) amidotransferase subunit E-like FAD-binding protein